MVHFRKAITCVSSQNVCRNGLMMHGLAPLLLCNPHFRVRERKKRNEMKGRKKSWTAMWLNLQILYWQQRRENRRDSKQASLAAAGMDGSHLLWWSFSDLSRGLEGELHYCPPTELRLSFWDGWRKHKGRIAWLNDLCPSKLLKPVRTSSGTNNRRSWKLHKWARADVMRHSLHMSHLAFFLCVWQNKKNE